MRFSSGRGRKKTAVIRRLTPTPVSKIRRYLYAFRKKVYHSIDELQADLDVWYLTAIHL